MGEYREGLLAAARVCRDRVDVWARAGSDSAKYACIEAAECERAILALSERTETPPKAPPKAPPNPAGQEDQRGAAALAAAADHNRRDSVDSQQREPLSNGVQSAPLHPAGQEKLLDEMACAYLGRPLMGPEMVSVPRATLERWLPTMEAGANCNRSNDDEELRALLAAGSGK